MKASRSSKKQPLRSTLFYREVQQHGPEPATTRGGWIVALLVILFLVVLAFWIFIPNAMFSMQQITGRVVSADNIPVENARIGFLDETVFTDSNGSFSFVFPAKDSVAALTISHPSATTPITRDVTMNGSGPRDFVIIFQRKGNLSVKRPTPSAPTRKPSVREPSSPAATKTVPGKSTYQGNQDSVLVNLTYETLTNISQQLDKNKFRLVDVETYFAEGTRLYSGVWNIDDNEHRLWTADGWESFLAKRDELNQEGYRILDLETYTEGGNRKFLGVWSKGQALEQRLWVDLSWQSFLQKWGDYADENYRLIDAEAYTENNSTRYAGIWQPGQGKFKLWKTGGMRGFVQKIKEFRADNLRLIDLEIILEDSQMKYFGVWGEGSEEHRVWLNEPWNSLQIKAKEFERENLRLIDLEVFQEENVQKYYGIWGPESRSEATLHFIQSPQN